MPAPTAKAVSSALRKLASPKKAAVLQRFFKTGPGEYADGDRFLGVMVPQQRTIAKRFADLPLPELRKLLRSPMHEERLTALLTMVRQYERGDARLRAALHRTYLANTRYINNWDLVDLSAPQIVGTHVARRPRPLLQRLVRSPLLWERRIAALATFHFIKNGDAAHAIWVVKKLLRDEHDLIHKAAGWMLRELGKRVSEKTLRSFLDEHAHTMPRTMLRYAIERLPAATRSRYLKRKAA
jgi:3-methyladenine DNA glycosylase AlkD